MMPAATPGAGLRFIAAVTNSSMDSGPLQRERAIRAAVAVATNARRLQADCSSSAIAVMYRSAGPRSARGHRLTGAGGKARISLSAHGVHIVKITAPYAGTQAVRRAVELLKSFPAAHPERSLTELALTVGLNRTTAYRLLTAL